MALPYDVPCLNRAADPGLLFSVHTHRFTIIKVTRAVTAAAAAVAPTTAATADPARGPGAPTATTATIGEPWPRLAGRWGLHLRG